MPKYDSIKSIPAHVFFEILLPENGIRNYQLLKPKPKEKGLDLIFTAIYDDWFLKSKNDDAKEYLKLVKEINYLEHKLSVVLNVTAFLHYNRETLPNEMLIENITALNQYCEMNIDLNFDSQEVERVLNVEVGIIKNDLNFAKIQLGAIKSDSGKVFNYYKSIVGISNALPNINVKEKMSLALYIELETAAIESIEARKTAA